MNIKRIKDRSASLADAMRRHPSAAVIWTLDDFDATVADALAVVAKDTATVYDFATGEVIA